MGGALLPLVGLLLTARGGPGARIKGLPSDLRSVPARHPHWSVYFDSTTKGTNLLLPSSLISRPGWRPLSDRAQAQS